MSRLDDPPTPMKIPCKPVTAVSMTAALLLAACSIAPQWLFGSGPATPRPVVVLSFCAEVQSVLCLAGFGLEPPDQMLIMLQASSGFPEILEAVVTRGDSEVHYSCESIAAASTISYCAGPQLPLGTSMQIAVYAVEEHTLLASGEFTLNALALPTVQRGIAEVAAPSATGTAKATRTPKSRAGTGTPSARTTARPTLTRLPGTAYPNP
jgi:hypothetical protein